MDRFDRADPEARRLLADYRADERMPPATREAAWLRLQAAIHEGTHDSPPELTTTTTTHTRRTHHNRLIMLGLAAAALALLFAGLGRLLGPRNLPERGNQAAHDLRDGTHTLAPPAGAPLRFTTVHAPDPQSPDSQSPDSQSPNSQSPDSQSPDSRSPDPQSPDSQSPDSQSHDSQSPNSQSHDIKSHDSQYTDSNSADPHLKDPQSPPTTDPQPPLAKRRPRRLPTADPDPALGLDAELSLLRRARAALAGSPQQALQLLGEHARRFPAGILAEERQLLRVQALCAVGEPDRARAAAREFARAHPDSPHTPTITAACDP